MYEYSFHGLEGNLTVYGTTTDFLQVLCEIAHSFNPEVTGQFTAALLEAQSKDLDCLRIIDWRFEHIVPEVPGQVIRVHKIS